MLRRHIARAVKTTLAQATRQVVGALVYPGISTRYLISADTSFNFSKAPPSHGSTDCAVLEVFIEWGVSPVLSEWSDTRA